MNLAAIHADDVTHVDVSAGGGASGKKVKTCVGFLIANYHSEDRAQFIMTPYVHPTEQLVVEIYVRDLKRSKAFYLQLGFDLLSEKERFVMLAWEDHRLFLEERNDISFPANFSQANVRIMVSDVDEFWKRVVEMKARVTNPIADRAYGLRDFTIADPDGFGLRFGSWLSRISE